MAWTWRFSGTDSPAGADGGESFSSQSDAESWLGQQWRALAAQGITTADLIEDDRVEYSMSLLPGRE